MNVKYHPEEAEGNISIYDKGEGEVHAAMHILQKFVAALGKVTTSHEEQTSPMKVLVFF